jgi:hypothetical protein
LRPDRNIMRQRYLLERISSIIKSVNETIYDMSSIYT